MTVTQVEASVCRRRRGHVPWPGGAVQALAVRDSGCRVLSVDFDGILHPAAPADATACEHPFGWLPLVAGVLAPYPDVGVLVHSTWRYAYSSSELYEMLGELGPRFVGATPLGPRYVSVRLWLQHNRAFTSCRIRDDDPTAFPTPAPPELILCDPRHGVSDARVQAALIEWLET